MASFGVELSASNRASCKNCKAKIEKGVPRWRKSQDNEAFNGVMKSYFHLQCIKVPRAGLEAEDVDFDENVGQEVRQEALKALEAAKAPKPAKKKKVKTDSSDQPPKKKVKKLDENLDEIDSDPIALKYNAMKISELKDYLRLNKQPLGGNKTELAAKCIDGERNGRLMPCPTCGKGRVSIDDRGMVVCKGYWDEDISMRIDCKHTDSPENAKRDKWLVPGIDQDEDEKDNENDVAGSDVSEKDLDKIRAAFEKLGDQPSAREIAAELVNVARRMGLSLPTEEGQAKMICASALMAHKSEDGSYDVCAAFIQLRSQHGTQAETKAKELKAESERPKARVPENQAIADIIDELGTLEAKCKEGANYVFKVKALKKAANAIRDCSFQIDSGKKVASGKNKLPGVGKSTGLMIDAFLTSGELARVSELRERVAQEGL